VRRGGIAFWLVTDYKPVYAGDLCKANSFTKSQAEQDKPEYNSSGFPPKNYVKFDSDMRIAAYILYNNCGKLDE
jgi:hypothetical protein